MSGVIFSKDAARRLVNDAKRGEEDARSIVPRPGRNHHVDWIVHYVRLTGDGTPTTLTEGAVGGGMVGDGDVFAWDEDVWTIGADGGAVVYEAVWLERDPDTGGDWIEKASVWAYDANGGTLTTDTVYMAREVGSAVGTDGEPWAIFAVASAPTVAMVYVTDTVAVDLDFATGGNQLYYHGLILHPQPDGTYESFDEQVWLVLGNFNYDQFVQRGAVYLATYSGKATDGKPVWTTTVFTENTDVDMPVTGDGDINVANYYENVFLVPSLSPVAIENVNMDFVRPSQRLRLINNSGIAGSVIHFRIGFNVEMPYDVSLVDECRGIYLNLGQSIELINIGLAGAPAHWKVLRHPLGVVGNNIFTSSLTLQNPSIIHFNTTHFSVNGETTLGGSDVAHSNVVDIRTLGASGSFTTADGKTATVQDGLITYLIAGGGGPPPPIAIPDATNSTITATTPVIADGVSQSVITVTVLNSLSAPLPGLTVTCTGTGSSVVAETSVVTDGAGVAVFHATDVIVETVTFTATCSGVSIGPSGNVDFALANVGVTNSAASSISCAPTAVANDGVATTTITVVLRDAYGGVVVGETVTITPDSPFAVVSPGSDVTDATGTVTFTATDTHAEGVSFQANSTTWSVGVGPSNTVVYYAIGSPTTANSSISATPLYVPNDGTSTTTLTATMLDANGDPCSGVTVNFSATGSAVLSSSTAVTNGSGIATVTATNTVAESVDFTADDGVMSPVGPATVSFAVASSVGFAQACSNNADIGTLAWSNPTNAQGSADSSFAAATFSGPSQRTQNLDCLDYSWSPSLPATKTVRAIQFRINSKSTQHGALPPQPIIVLVKGGSLAGTLSAGFSSGGPFFSTSAAWSTYGGPSSLPPVTLSTDDLGSTFGLRIAAQNGTNLDVASVDAVEITVWYDQ